MRSVLLSFSIFFASLVFVAVAAEVRKYAALDAYSSPGALIWKTAKAGDTAALTPLLASAIPAHRAYQRICGVNKHL
jgi:hypothetical protein